MTNMIQGAKAQVAKLTQAAYEKAARQIAQIIVDHLELEGSYFQKVEIAGPGFLNFTLGPKWYGEVLSAVETEGDRYGSGEEGRGKRVMVEFVSANPTGPMHMGNARGGVLGDTLAKIAAQKAGIIKPDTLVVSAYQEPEAAQVIEETCRRQHSGLQVVDESQIRDVRYGAEVQMFSQLL